MLVVVSVIMMVCTMVPQRTTFYWLFQWDDANPKYVGMTNGLGNHHFPPSIQSNLVVLGRKFYPHLPTTSYLSNAKSQASNSMDEKNELFWSSRLLSSKLTTWAYWWLALSFGKGRRDLLNSNPGRKFPRWRLTNWWVFVFDMLGDEVEFVP